MILTADGATNGKQVLREERFKRQQSQDHNCSNYGNAKKKQKCDHVVDEAHGHATITPVQPHEDGDAQETQNITLFDGVHIQIEASLEEISQKHSSMTPNAQVVRAVND